MSLNFFPFSFFKQPKRSRMKTTVTKRQKPQATEQNAQHTFAEEPLEVARIYLEYGRWMQAKDVLEVYLRSHPKDARALAMLEETNRELTPTRAIDQPQDGQDRKGFFEAEIYHAYGRYSQAWDSLQAHLKTFPQDLAAITLLEKVEAELEIERSMKATAPIKEKAIPLSEAVEEAKIYHAYGRYEQAKALLTTALAENPHDPAALALLDQVNTVLSIPESNPTPRPAVATEAEPQAGEVSEAEIYHAYGRYEKAHEILEPYLKRNPKDAVAVKLMARIKEALGKA